eukprot:jgi/Chlat1/5849/Chrsp4S06234
MPAATTTPSVAVPGDRLGSSAECRAGNGALEREDGGVYAAVVGAVRWEPAEPKDKDQRPTVSVARHHRNQSAGVPSPGAIVTCRHDALGLRMKEIVVLRVTPRLATAAILCVGADPTDEAFSGIIRVQDVRATEIDKVDMYSCFRPGDIVRAEVVSLGDARSYYLSTARNELGVVFARSASASAASAVAGAAAPMVPVSWQEMQCPVTGTREKRKVAKVS